MSLPPPHLEQAHVRLAEDYAKLREEYDEHVNASETIADRWLSAEFQFRATIETQQVTIQALTAVLGAMRDNERTLRSEVASLTAELDENAQLLLDAGQEVSRLKEELATKDLVAQMWKYANLNAVDVDPENLAPHKWDLRS